MKKLSLKNLNLTAKDLLPLEQLKAVFGGYGDESCPSSCSSDSDCGGTGLRCKTYYCHPQSLEIYHACG